MSKGVVRVARVTSCTVTADRSVFEAAIDLPIQGMAVNIEEFTISGWIIEQSEGLRALRVEIRVVHKTSLWLASVAKTWRALVKRTISDSPSR